MKTVTVRRIQRQLSEVLRWVADGQEVLITKRNRIIAKIVSVNDGHQTVQWPDFLRRSTGVWGKRARVASVSRLIIEDRKERFEHLS